MSSRHEYTTWRAQDKRALDALFAAKSDVAALTNLMAALPVAPDSNARHCEAVWRRPLPPAARPHVLRQIFHSAPKRWAPVLAQAILDGSDDYVDATFDELSSVFELRSIPRAYGVVLFLSPAFAARFNCSPPGLQHGQAMLRAFGGEPKQGSPLAAALNDTTIGAKEVRAIATMVVVPASLPDLPWSTPFPIAGFEVDPAYLVGVISEVADFFRRAADANLQVQILWHPNP
ncbi:MAG: hypothetical protein HN348_28225 [Proteobacteria bacterium]|nr:hypothetical protein [Pseudomonadota bacterium]